MEGRFDSIDSRLDRMDSRFQSRFDRINTNLQYRRRETPQLIMLLAPASLVHTMEMPPSSSPIGQFQGLRILRRTPPSRQSTARDQCSLVGFTPQWVCSRTITRKPELPTDFTRAPADSVHKSTWGKAAIMERNTQAKYSCTASPNPSWSATSGLCGWAAGGRWP